VEGAQGGTRHDAVALRRHRHHFIARRAESPRQAESPRVHTPSRALVPEWHIPHVLLQTPLHSRHQALGAKLVPFAGWELPVHYPAGLLAEHRAVRERCGLFDVSHMGEFVVTGPQAVAFLDHVTTNHVAGLAEGQLQYSTICDERGMIVDDCLVYRRPHDLYLVVNASNKDKDFAHLQGYVAPFDCTLRDISDDVALLALQGPRAQAVLQPLCAAPLDPVGYYRATSGAVAGVECFVSRNGYTGEDGFEIACPPAQAGVVWDALLASGEVTPCGLGCRDTLRLEVGFALYGNDIDDTTTPLEGGLGWTVKFKSKGDFVGRAALEAQKAAGVPRALVGFTVAERGAIPRHGYPVFVDGAPSGQVLSGTMSPTLGVAIGTAYVPPASAAPGSALEVEIRGKRVTGTVVALPFYKHGTVRR
jgi:aminomethyltransferase